jgi:translation initiation factor IF-3
LRVNDQIRIPTVRLFDDTTGEQLGIVPIERARELAAQREVDLVEVAPLAQPPVCRLMDYGRFKFEALKKEKESRKEHNTINVKEMKLRPKISEHDFQTKFGSVRHFLADGDKVKLTIMFRGREMVHQEYGRKLLDRMAEELKEIAIIERNPLVEGRNMIMIMSPLNKKHAKGDQHSNDRRPTAETGGSQVSQADAAPTQESQAEEAQTDGTKIQEVEISVTVPVDDSGAESGSNDHAEDTNP